MANPMQKMGAAMGEAGQGVSRVEFDRSSEAGISWIAGHVGCGFAGLRELDDSLGLSVVRTFAADRCLVWQRISLNPAFPR